MLMSKSRLEKFLYALYSLDSSDLPTPLSRIEELYKCLVTGEEPPTFEPLSRVEKYLMAILGGYDVDSLPNPLSRVEVLLYKLATGDDNLDDVKSFLSEHEELLAEIIRNGGVGGNIDIEYVLHTLSSRFNTLYNTAEKPVKSAILKGQTLINLWNNSGQHSIAPGSWIEQMGDCFKKSTKYLLKYNVLQTNTNNSMIVQYYQNGPWVSNEKGYMKLNEDYYILTTPSVDFNKILIFYNSTFGTETVILEDIMLLEYQDGMENWDIPYFEGMKSVQMPVLRTVGKNVLGSFLNKTFKPSSATVSYEHKDCEITVSSTDVGWRRVLVSDFEVIPGKTYAFSFDQEIISGDPYITITVLGENGSKYIYGEIIEKYDRERENTYYELNIRPEDSKITIGFYSSDAVKFGKVRYYNIQLEKGSTATTYEPFKTNILTVNEEVELRGVGDVQDELNLLTGELTQRVGESVITDGYWSFGGDHSKTNVRFHYSNRILKGANTPNYDIICDKIPTLQPGFSYDVATYGIGGLQSDIIYLFISRSLIGAELDDNDVTSLNAKIKVFFDALGDVTVQYKLAEESVKTVDLSVVNQDGNDTKLSTFNDITHVTLSSEGLIPEAELEVATKNEEVLNTMSLEMDDISTTQTTLEETSNAQSENVDSTMIATTEIYEGLL